MSPEARADVCAWQAKYHDEKLTFFLMETRNARSIPSEQDSALMVDYLASDSPKLQYLPGIRLLDGVMIGESAGET
jgi:hypothetical protein